MLKVFVLPILAVLTFLAIPNALAQTEKACKNKALSGSGAFYTKGGIAPSVSDDSKLNKLQTNSRKNIGSASAG